MEEYRNSKHHSTRLATASREAVETSSSVLLNKAEREQQLLAELTDLVLRRFHSEPSAAFDIAARAGVSAEDMADHFIPTVARSLGDLWCSDQLGFADVTIGVARLQAMLRDFGETWSGDHGMNPDASTVLLVVLDGAYHTLGAFVIAGQLRRKGLSVRVFLAANPENIAEACRMTQYDAVFISSNVGENLEKLRKIVKSVKKACECVPPVLIGGSLLESTADVIALTGADYIATNADEAIALCNLRSTTIANVALDH